MLPALLASSAHKYLCDTLTFVWLTVLASSPSGKTILVTGATDGIGFHCARAFAEHGARVIIHGRNEEKARA